MEGDAATHRCYIRNCSLYFVVLEKAGHMDSDSSNSLKQFLDLIPRKVDSSAASDMASYPGAWGLKVMGKRGQTEEMLRKAIEFEYDMNDWHQCCASRLHVLKYASKRVMTYNLCLQACERDAYNLPYVPEKYLDDAMFLAAMSNDCLLYTSPSPRD